MFQRNSSMSVQTTESFVCVHCGSRVKCLMKTYSPTVLKLVNCKNCGNVADKYLEYDDVVILIDIILFNKEAYRHLLFNTKFQNHWKLALIILITKTANEWSSMGSDTSQKSYSMSCYEKKVFSFFLNFLITILGEFVYFLIICCFFIIYPNTFTSYVQEIKTIWKATVSSSFGYFLLLPSLIWSGFQRDIHYIFIFVYALLSHIQALTVVFTIQRSLLAGLLVFASGTNYLVSYFLRWLFNVT